MNKDKIYACKRTKKYYLEFGSYEERFKKIYYVSLELILEIKNGEITDGEMIFCLHFPRYRMAKKRFKEILEEVKIR